jgi:hypothetical protein
MHDFSILSAAEMSKPKFFAGLLLAAIIGPALGISGNSMHSTGMIVAAICFSLTGIGLMLFELIASKAR